MVGGTKRPPQDSESGPWSHEQSNTKSNSNTKTFHEEESQNLSRVHVSLDNADTVIEGGPHLPHQKAHMPSTSASKQPGGCPTSRDFRDVGFPTARTDFPSHHPVTTVTDT